MQFVSLAIEVEAQLLYGTWRLRPRNEAARIFAELADDATLSSRTLRHAKRLGYTITETNGRQDVLAKLMEA